MKIRYLSTLLLSYAFFVVGMEQEGWIVLNEQVQVLNNQGHYQAANAMDSLISRMKDLQETKQQYVAISGESPEPSGFLVFKGEQFPEGFQIPVLTFENDASYYMSDEQFDNFVLFIVNKVIAFESKQDPEYWNTVQMLYTMTTKVIEVTNKFKNKIINIQQGQEQQTRPWWKRWF